MKWFRWIPIIGLFDLNLFSKKTKTKNELLCCGWQLFG